jgi:predicted enzyme related to lactoylglutathione lyase
MNDYDNFFLPAGDLEQGKKFYGELLGLPVKFDFSSRGMVAFKVGEQEPAIILSSRKDARSAIWFSVDDVPRTFDMLEAKGVKFLSKPFAIQTGMAVEFEDPFGNKLGITDYSRKVPAAG